MEVVLNIENLKSYTAGLSKSLMVANISNVWNWTLNFWKTLPRFCRGETKKKTCSAYETVQARIAVVYVQEIGG